MSIREKLKKKVPLIMFEILGLDAVLEYIDEFKPLLKALSMSMKTFEGMMNKYISITTSLLEKVDMLTNVIERIASKIPGLQLAGGMAGNIAGGLTGSLTKIIKPT